MTSHQKYDSIIIGSSRAAVYLSISLAQAGKRIALIERDLVGGTCLNVGCTPTKAMAASARVAYLASRADEFGVETGPVAVDMRTVIHRKRKILKVASSFVAGMLEKTVGLELVIGNARFTGPKSVEVRLNNGNVSQLTGETIFINTGLRPTKPPIPGLDSIATLDNASILELDTLPEHLVVLGGGYVGLEFAQMFRRFGSQVTILQMDKQLLSQEDTDVAAEVTKILEEDGIEVLLEANTLRVEQTSNAKIQLTVNTSEERRIFCSHLLVATGRAPNTEELNLEAAGVEIDDRGFVQVNERLETGIPGIYAFGDVKGGPAFTHIAFDDFRILRTNLLSGGDATTTGRMVPYVVFIDPQLARVGLSESEAITQGRNIRVAKLPMGYIGPTRPLELSETRGFMKVIVDADSHQILGVTILGIEGGEIMSVLQVAMMSKLPYTAIRDGIFAHPTLAEMLNELFMSMDMASAGTGKG